MIGPEVRAPDVTQPVIGYRQFALERYSQHNYRLVSPHQREPWPTVEMWAKCSRELAVPEGIVLPFPPKPHAAPHKDCGCGIYAYFDPCPVSEERDPYYGRLFANDPSKIMALVTLTGRVEVHARGMRAERARVCALGTHGALSSDERAALTVIAEQFDVPCLPQAEIPAIASEFGAPLDDSVRPAAPPLPTPPQLGPARVEPRPRAYVPPVWIVGMNAGLAFVNLGCYVATDSPFNAGAMLTSGMFAAWYAGRRRQAKV